MSGEIIRDQVNDVQWSPNTSSCFGSVGNDGRIEIWDLGINELNPVITHFDKVPGGDENSRDNTPKTIVRFSAKSPVLLTGNVNGQVDVYRTKGLEHVQVSDQDQRARLLKSIKKDTFISDDKEGKEGQ